MEVVKVNLLTDMKVTFIRSNMWFC